MPMRAEFTIHSAPTGKARPRVTMHGTYTPRKTKQYEDLVRSEYISQCIGTNFGENALEIDITAVYAVPKSANKETRWKMLSGEIRPTKKPDYDNISKAVCDALNGLAYKDDAQIVDAHCHKVYGEIPMVIVTIEEV